MWTYVSFDEQPKSYGIVENDTFIAFLNNESSAQVIVQKFNEIEKENKALKEKIEEIINANPKDL